MLCMQRIKIRFCKHYYMHTENQSEGMCIKPSSLSPTVVSNMLILSAFKSNSHPLLSHFSSTLWGCPPATPPLDDSTRCLKASLRQADDFCNALARPRRAGTTSVYARASTGRGMLYMYMYKFTPHLVHSGWLSVETAVKIPWTHSIQFVWSVQKSNTCTHTYNTCYQWSYLLLLTWATERNKVGENDPNLVAKLFNHQSIWDAEKFKTQLAWYVGMYWHHRWGKYLPFLAAIWVFCTHTALGKDCTSLTK